MHVSLHWTVDRSRATLDLTSLSDAAIAALLKAHDNTADETAAPDVKSLKVRLKQSLKAKRSVSMAKGVPARKNPRRSPPRAPPPVDSDRKRRLPDAAAPQPKRQESAKAEGRSGSKRKARAPSPGFTMGESRTAFDPRTKYQQTLINHPLYGKAHSEQLEARKNAPRVYVPLKEAAVKSISVLKWGQQVCHLLQGFIEPVFTLMRESGRLPEFLKSQQTGPLQAELREVFRLRLAAEFDGLPDDVARRAWLPLWATAEKLVRQGTVTAPADILPVGQQMDVSVWWVLFAALGVALSSIVFLCMCSCVTQNGSNPLSTSMSSLPQCESVIVPVVGKKRLANSFSTRRN